MATILTTKAPGVGTPRVNVTARRAPRRSGRQVLAPVLACYIGLALMVLVGLGLRELLPRTAAVAIFVVVSLVLVVALHPRITLRR